LVYPTMAYGFSCLEREMRHSPTHLCFRGTWHPSPGFTWPCHIIMNVFLTLFLFTDWKTASMK